MVWLVIETFVLLLVSTAVGIGIGAVLRKIWTGDSATLAHADDRESFPEGQGFAPLEPDLPPRVTEVPAARPPENAALPEGVIDPTRAAAADQVGIRPAMLAGPRDGAADDLKRIKGIGPQNESRLNALGIYHFDQIAAWSPEEARWVGSYLAFPGRIEREKWVDQARALVSEPA